jgi:hypothetical protein
VGIVLYGGNMSHLSAIETQQDWQYWLVICNIATEVMFGVLWVSLFAMNNAQKFSIVFINIITTLLSIFMGYYIKRRFEC